MRIGMRFPGIDENGAFIGERDEPIAHRKLRVGPLDLQQDMAMRVRVPHQGDPYPAAPLSQKWPRAMRRAFDIA